MPDTSARVTLKDIAARVGVTPAAVSMGLAGNTRIGKKTRHDIRQAAAELGYVPSSAGRALRENRAGTVALIVPTTARHVFGHSYFMHILEGVSSVANEHDIKLLIATNPDEDHGLAAYERVMRSHSADGAILTSAAIDDATVERLSHNPFPVVLIGNFPYLPAAITIGINDRAASALITEHLLDRHKRRKLVHITGALDHQTGIDRRDGFLEAVAVHELLPDSIVVEGDLSEESGRTAIRELRGRIDDIDGVVAANDDMAFGAMDELKSLGKRVPQAISLVGFDDFGLARVTSPAITTVHVPAERIARLATERLFELVDDSRAGGWLRRVIEVEVVIRQSCGCS